MQEVAQNAASNINEFLNYYINQLEPQIFTTLTTAKNTLTNAAAMLTKVQSIIPQATQLLSNAQKLSTAQNTLTVAQSDFPTLSKKLSNLPIN